MLARNVPVLALGAAISLAGFAEDAPAQSAGLAARQTPSLVTITYPVADLVVPIDMEPGEKKPATGTREDNLMKTIRTTVAPSSWRENGGPATMAYHALGMGLVIQQSPGEHDKIRELLRNLRRLQDVEVAVEIRLVTLPQGRMADVLQEGRDLSDIQLFQFLEAAQGDRSFNVMQAPKMTVFNAQKAKFSDLDYQSFVTGIKLAGEKENLTARPETEKVALRVSFWVRPVVSPDRRYVTMTLGAYLANLQGPVPSMQIDAPAPQGKRNQITVQLPTVNKVELEKTLKVADGATTIVRLGRKRVESCVEISPPIVTKIPYLGRLFKNVSYAAEASESFLLVTPRIIIREEEEEVLQR